MHISNTIFHVSPITHRHILYACLRMTVLNHDVHLRWTQWKDKQSLLRLLIFPIYSSYVSDFPSTNTLLVWCVFKINKSRALLVPLFCPALHVVDFVSGKYEFSNSVDSDSCNLFVMWSVIIPGRPKKQSKDGQRKEAIVGDQQRREISRCRGSANEKGYKRVEGVSVFRTPIRLYSYLAALISVFLIFVCKWLWGFLKLMGKLHFSVLGKYNMPIE